MTKQPLHNIDSLFQEKLEELPVDVSLQHQQWQTLSQMMHQQPTSWLAQLHKPWVKWCYLTVVALLPFGIFYYVNQPQHVVYGAAASINGSITKSLPALNMAAHTIQHSEATASTPAASPVKKKGAGISEPVISHSPVIDIKQIESVQQPEKRNDSTVTVPIKKEQPKKADSTYIYWQ